MPGGRRAMTTRFPAPWRIVEIPNGFAVDDATGQQLGVFYGRADPNPAGHTGFLTIDEARQLAVDFARLPELLKRASGAAKLLLLRSNSVDPYDASAHISPASGGKAVITAVAVVAGMLLLIGFVCGYGVR